MEKDKKIQSKIIETYAEDMAKVIENDKTGLIKKIIHGEEEHEIEKRNLSPESKKNKFFMFVGLFFIAFGVFTLFYFFLKTQVPTIPVEQQFIPLIFSDKNVFVEVAGLNKDKIIQTIFNTIQEVQVKTGGVVGIYPIDNKKNVGLRSFLTLIKSNLVLDNDPLLVKDNFLMGVINGETKSAYSSESEAGGDFFILLKVRSMADIFDSLRAWEDKMFFDMHGFFGLGITSETSYLLTADFEDGIVENKNARILYQKEDTQALPEDPLSDTAEQEAEQESQSMDRKIVMMYIFADDNSVIITNTKNAAREVMLRLAMSQIKK